MCSNARLVILLAVVLVAAAQTPDTATVQGRIQDQTRSGIADVRVVVKNAQTQLERSAITGADGGFTVAGLPAGPEYRIIAAHDGFAEGRSAALTLAGGATVAVTLILTVAPGQTEMNVTGVPGEVRTDEPQLGVRLDARQMEATPLLNRRITWLPLLNAANHPAISQGDVFMNQTLFTTNGAGRRQAWFEVDGATGNDSWGRQTIFSTVPLAAVEEMAVLTNAFSAEFGGSTGSVVNVVTKSGGNRLHGELLELWRPSATAAALAGFNASTATSGNQLTSDTLGQTSAALSGPLGASGRTHFFTAAEYSRQDRSSPITSPIAPGPYVGHYRGWLGLLRLDHQINANHNAFLRANLDGFHDTNPNGIVGGNSLPTVARVFRRRTYSIEAGETAALSPTLINNVRLQFQLASPITQFDPVVYGTQYQVPVSTGGTFTTGTSQSALLQNRQYQVSDTLSAIRGAHQLKFGGSMIRAHNGGNSKEFGGPLLLGQFIYNTCTQPLSVCESAAYLGNLANVRSYTQSYGNANYTVDDTLWALFVQDDYKVRPDLTVNLGLRYEQQTFTDARKNFAPRVGFAYNWRGDGVTVLRGGYGVYYSQIVDDTAANWALSGPEGVFNYTATPGQIGFPSSVAAAPLPSLPSGAAVPVRSLYVRAGNAAYLNQFFPVSTLAGYPDRLLNPYSQQWTFGVERRLAGGWVLAADYVGSHTIRINRPLDVDAPAPFIRTAAGQTRSAQAANCTRPYWIAWYRDHGMTCSATTASNPQPPYSVIQTDVNNGYSYYHALDINLERRFSSRLAVLASYVWSHAIDNVDPDIPSQSPNDPNFTGKVENGDAIFDQRQRLVVSGVYVLPLKISFGGVGTIGSGLPFNIVTGTNNSGDTGATTDRPVIDGVVIGRNAGRGRPIYDVSAFLERPFAFFGERVRVVGRAEAFNLLNHANFVGYSGTWGNGNTAGAGFGQPLAGITAQLPARSVQFSLKVAF
ncbi:MAG: TonB-dependent receptor [Acidobacteria bacterium]|nr:TonB-dependent receptor [Acidobacteriota bacterium]